MAAKRNSRNHLLGVGLDGRDGHVRITKGPDFSVYMGSEATHEKMQEICLKVNERLQKRGETIETASPRRVKDLIDEMR